LGNAQINLIFLCLFIFELEALKKQTNWQRD